MSFGDFIRSMTEDGGLYHSHIPENWMQGRTAYGGLSAAIALTAAHRATEDAPPLRSAQIAFIGPLSGPVTARAEILRRGKSSAYVGVDVSDANGLGLRATFVFMKARPSHIDFCDLPPPETVDPVASVPAFKRTPGPHFTGQFEYLHARPQNTTAEPSDLLRWTRLADRGEAPSEAELMVIGDALPPASMGLMTEKGPVSSMNWTLNVLTNELTTRNGWWLLRSRADQAQQGCSSQSMTIWNADGLPVASAIQSVALFT